MQKKVRPKKQLIRSTQQKATQIQKALTWAKSNKKKAVMIGLSGALLFGGARYYRDVPYLIGAKKHYQLELLFSRHKTIEDVKQIATALREARLKGKPYHLMLVEANGLPKEEVPKTIKDWSKRAEVMRTDYQNLARQGITGEEATNRLREHYGKSMSKGYTLEVCLLLAKEGVRIAPAEGYLKETLSKIKEIDRQLTTKENALQTSVSANAPLSELQQRFGETTTLYQQLAKIREGPTIQNIKEIVTNAKQIFPELRKEREVRVFSQFGTHHREGMSPAQFESKKIAAREIIPRTGYSLEVIHNPKDGPAYGEYESRLRTLSYYLDEPINALAFGDQKRGIMKNAQQANKIYSSALKTTQEEFLQLSETTKKMTPLDRVNFLLNYFLKK